MPDARLPDLTGLDRMVLEYLPRGRGVRASKVLEVTQRHHRRYGSITREDVRQLLRGLEHLGLAVNDNGWWRRIGGNAPAPAPAAREAA